MGWREDRFEIDEKKLLAFLTTLEYLRVPGVSRSVASRSVLTPVAAPPPPATNPLPGPHG